jgi:uridine kinase
MNDKPLLIGICGGTGSGKTTVAKAIFRSFPEKNIAIIEQDSYYKDQAHLTMDQRVLTNYDHPLSFDTELLLAHLKELLAGEAIQKPIYDFSIHTRSNLSIEVQPRDIIILEGIMILEDKRLRDLMDLKIFVDTDADIRIIRRIKRDMEERKRTLDSVIKQYIQTVKPAHEQFIEPYKKFADLIIPEGGHNKVAIEVMVSTVKAWVRG